MILKKYSLLLLLLCGTLSTTEGMTSLSDLFQQRSAQANQPTVKKSLKTLKDNLGTLQTQLTNLHEQLASLHLAITNPEEAQAAAAEKAALKQAAAAQKAAQEEAAQQAARVDATIAAIAESAASLTKTGSSTAAEYDEVKAHILDQLVEEENRITAETTSASNTGAISMTPGILLAIYAGLREAINTNTYTDFTSQTQPEPAAYNALRELLKARATHAVELQLHALIQSFNKDTDTYDATKTTCITTLTSIVNDARWATERFSVLDESRELLTQLQDTELPTSSTATNRFVSYIFNYINFLKQFEDKRQKIEDKRQQIAQLKADPTYLANKNTLITLEAILTILDATTNQNARVALYNQFKTNSEEMMSTLRDRTTLKTIIAKLESADATATITAETIAGVGINTIFFNTTNTSQSTHRLNQQKSYTTQAVSTHEKKIEAAKSELTSLILPQAPSLPEPASSDPDAKAPRFDKETLQTINKKIATISEFVNSSKTKTLSEAQKILIDELTTAANRATDQNVKDFYAELKTAIVTNNLAGFKSLTDLGADDPYETIRRKLNTLYQKEAIENRKTLMRPPADEDDSDSESEDEEDW